jgi:hypothetical protein
MSFVNQNLSQNVAGGLGGRADAQLAEEARRNQVQPSKDIMVARTSTGTFLTLREPKRSSTETTTTTTGSGSSTTVTNTLGVEFGHASGSMLKYVYDDNDAKVYFCGEASVNSLSGSSNVKWISPPIGAAAAVADSTQGGLVFSGTPSQFNFGLWPIARGVGFGTTSNSWQLSDGYDVAAGVELWLVKLSEPVEVVLNTHLPISGNVYGSERLTAEYIDMNPINRQWEWSP